MSFELGRNIRLHVTGASHSAKITVSLSGIPKGKNIDMYRVQVLLDRRAGGQGIYTTPRKEADTPINIKGIDADGVTTGETIEAEFINSNQRSKDYGNIKKIPRPSHADFAAYTKFGLDFDLSGGSFFSGRMTLPMCFAGEIVRQLLEEEGILIGAHISSVGDVSDDPFDPLEECLEFVPTEGLPVLSAKAGEAMEKLMNEIALDGDSIGGTIECKVTGLPVGLGDPIYDSVESAISYGIFGIPAVKGIEFGRGFDITRLRGSEANDPFSIKDGRVVTLSNNSGGIQGGLTNGMPLLFKVAIKPTASIGKEQKSVNLETMEETTITVKGRHDSCIVVRAVPCVEAMCALVIYDLLGKNAED